MIRRILALALVLALAPGAFALDLEGRWRVDGRDPERGPFSGLVDVARDPKQGLRYERRVRFDLEKPFEVERGAIAVRGAEIVTTSDATGSDFASELGAKRAASRVRRATLRAQGEALDGDFAFDGARAGHERLERSEGGDSFELLVDGREFYPRLEADIAASRRSIHIETFAWHPDGTGSRIASLLEAKARAGVEVRLIVDDFESSSARKIIERVRAAGGEVAWANPKSLKLVGDELSAVGRWTASLFGPVAPRERAGILNREHRKVIVVDGLAAYTGGMGMTDEYVTWHDVMCRVEGPVVRRIQTEFFERWRAYGGAPRDPRLYVAERTAPAGDLKLSVIVSVPGLVQEGKQVYLAEIGRARRKILIENPYFIDDDVIGALEKKVRAGVPVSVIAPNDHSQDEPVVQHALAWIESDIVKSGIDLRKFRPTMIHAKVAAIDGEWTTIGSHNLDALSLEKLSELNLAARDPRLARLFEKRLFEVDLPRADKVVPGKLGFWQAAKSGVWYFFRGMI